MSGKTVIPPKLGEGFLADSTTPNSSRRMRPASTEARRYQFDVFLSCHESDRDWVEAELFKPLQAAGIKVTWEWEFSIGVDVIAARNEAVKSSRHTLVVCTQAWCDSPLNQDDALSSRFLDPNAADRKILPLIAGKCELPETLRRVKAYEFTDISVRQATLPRLLVELGQSRQTVNEVMSQFAQLGIRALVELMKTPEVRVAVHGIQAAFVEARDEIEELSRCKKMHEYFHRADEEYLRFKEDKEQLQLLLQTHSEEVDDWQAQTEDAWMALDAFVNDKLTSSVQDLMVLAGSGDYRPEQVLWLPAIDRAIKELARASENQEIKPLNRASERLSQIFGEWPSRFDHQLFEAAQRLRLSAVVGALGSIRDATSRFEFQPDVTARLSVFSRGIAALSELGERVQDLVVGHNCLQYIDDTLQTLANPCTCVDDIEKARWVWPDLEPTMDKLVPLSNPSWVAQFQSTRNAFVETVAAETPDDVDSRTIAKISSRLARFRSTVRTGFTRVDLELLGLCDRLQKIRIELSEAIRNLQYE